MDFNASKESTKSNGTKSEFAPAAILYNFLSFDGLSVHTSVLYAVQTNTKHLPRRSRHWFLIVGSNEI